MDPAKISLSEKELELVQDPSVLLTKNRIISKVVSLFGEVSETIQAEVVQLVSLLGFDGGAVSPKISRGENYLGLPWVMLDFPRFFGKEETFAIRTWFWWGNYFTQTLHLKGAVAELAGNRFMECLPELAAYHYYIAVEPDEWEHRVEMPYALPIDGELLNRQLRSVVTGGFLKLSVRYEISEWDSLPKNFAENVQLITRILTP